MVPMMASLAAACGVIAICAGTIVALGMAVRYLEPAGRRSPAPAGPRRSLGPAIRFRSEASLADRRRQGRGVRQGTVAERGADREPKRAGAASEDPVPALILPFAQKPPSRPRPQPDKPPLVATWRSRRDRDGEWIVHLG
jgi:hypothetical protein